MAGRARKPSKETLMRDLPSPTNYKNNNLYTQVENLEPSDNNTLLKINVAIMDMPEIDLTDQEQVRKRLDEYFLLYAESNFKPTVAGMAASLGMNRRSLSSIVHDRPVNGKGQASSLPKQTTVLLKKAYFLLENLWESYMNSGKINPVTGIFLGKNNYDYQDKTEYVLTPNTQQDDYNPEDIKARYLIDGESSSKS